MDELRAFVREIDGQLVLEDPDAVAVMRAVSKHNCRGTLEANADRVAYFAGRVRERNLTSADVVIVLLSVDDIHGGPLADMLMPGTDWQEIRARGEVPFARGLAGREGIQKALEIFDPEAAEKLHNTGRLGVVVVDYGVAEVFSA